MVEVDTSLNQGQCLSYCELHPKMDASILVAGNTQFLTTFVNQIGHIVSGTVEASSDFDEVIALIQAKQPDILIVQATQVGSLELCHQIKEKTNLGWTYCILVNDRSEMIDEGISPDPCWDIKAYAEALRNGADAYLQISSVGMNDSAKTLEANPLLKAQIQAGLRGVKVYRKLMQTNDLLSTMALADPLTELSNRRAMEWELPRQIQSARRYSTPLSLIMVDVDYFKSVNDNYGHQVGDRILQLLAARLQHNLRLQDNIFRYGGEEFTIVLSQTNFEDAQIVAKRLRSLVSDQPFHINETLALQITISLGLASLTATDDPKGETLLRRADHNLLHAKASGRNQVCCGEDSF